MRGVAGTSGNRVFCGGPWYRRNLKGEALGSIVHELVHVVQQYGRARLRNPDAARTPVWVVEGIADYIRWFLYEPQTHGAEITRRNLARARFDASYRVSANFINWVTKTHDKDIVKKLNAAAREGRYSDELWKKSSNWQGCPNRRSEFLDSFSSGLEQMPRTPRPSTSCSRPSSHTSVIFTARGCSPTK